MIAAQSVNYVERFIFDDGHTCLRLEFDYGYDVTIRTHDAEGYAEPGWINLQLKASENLREVRGKFVFDLDMRDYHLWNREIMPVILVLFDANRRRAYWLHIQAYFRQPGSMRSRSSGKTIRVHVSRRRTVNQRAVGIWREIKNQWLAPYAEEEFHA